MSNKKHNPQAVSKNTGTKVDTLSNPNKVRPTSSNNLNNDPDTANKAVAVVVSLAIIGLVLSLAFVGLPKLMEERDPEKQARLDQITKEKQLKDQEERKAKVDKELVALNFDKNKEWQVKMSIKDFGDINLDLKEEYAPKSVQNFVQLSHRGYYNNTVFHRIAKDENFAIIQGGDPTASGSGGETALFESSEKPNYIPDELWKVKPEYEIITPKEGQEAQARPEQKLKNNPEFRKPELYNNFNKEEGRVDYKKGLILMAKTSAPDSASSQFFITLDKTNLPAQYTVFGTVSESSMNVIDKIRNEVKPTPMENMPELGDEVTDGKPDKELKIEKVEIINPKV